MIDYTARSLRDFCLDLASDNPVPGGGSVSAYVAALAVALLKKTLVFTLRKQVDAQTRKEVTEVLAEADKLLQDLLDLVNQDSRVFMACLDDKKSPFSQRFAPAREIAQRICDLCQMAYKVHAKGSYLYNKSMKSDYEAVQRLIDAAFRISWENAHYGEEN